MREIGYTIPGMVGSSKNDEKMCFSQHRIQDIVLYYDDVCNMLNYNSDILY